MIDPKIRRKRGPFDILTRVHGLQSRLAQVYGKPSRGMQTSLVLMGKPVVFLHNPKTGGRSLRELLGAKHLSHSFPSQRMSERAWLATFSVVAVRDPFERFLSGYFDHVRKPQENALSRMYGPEFKKITPWQYLDILIANPKFGGPQCNWTDYPCADKPRADMVLRFEEIEKWQNQIVAAGLDVGARELPHRNQRNQSQSDPMMSLSMDKEQYQSLEAKVRFAFRKDALAFGYKV